MIGSLLFSPYKLRGTTFKNRIVLPPMCQWLSDAQGAVLPYHLAHYGQRAIAGTAMIIVEAPAVEERGRISGRDLGLWSDKHVEGMSRLAETIAEFGCVPGIQLGHAGRKAWIDGPRAVAPSAVQFSHEHQLPEAMSMHDIEQAAHAFRDAAVRASDAGFRLLEMHAAHGYLIHQFLSPISNKRTDEFGGSTENRLRFALMVAREIRSAVPPEVLLAARVSATEYHEEGYSMDEMTLMCRQLVEAGCDIIHVSSGGSVSTAPSQWPGYQLGYAAKIRSALLDVPVIGVGRLESAELAEFALREGFCDFVAVGREMLRNPNWPSHAALRLSAKVPVVEPLAKQFQPE